MYVGILYIIQIKSKSRPSRSCTVCTCCYVRNTNTGVQKVLIRLQSVADSKACLECFQCSRHETGTDLRQKRADENFSSNLPLIIFMIGSWLALMYWKRSRYRFATRPPLFTRLGYARLNIRHVNFRKKNVNTETYSTCIQVLCALKQQYFTVTYAP